MSPSKDINAQPLGEPPVWSDKRQALCDALPYFKSHQGGLYTSGSVAKGILLDSEASIRDTMASDVIILALGGGRAKEGGQMMRLREGSINLRRASANAMKGGQPIGVVVGRNYPFLDIQLKHEYSVLDWFTITDMWVEKDATDICIYKLRLEKTNKSDPSWWLPKPTQDEIGCPSDKKQDAQAYPAVRMECGFCEWEYAQIFTEGWVCLNAECEYHLLLEDGRTLSTHDAEYASTCAARLDWCTQCHQPSKNIFEQGWACLNKECSSFFDFAEGVDADELSYSQDFLHERTHCPAALEPLQPRLPDLAKTQAGTDINFRLGVVCPKCHGCSRRKDWSGWVYETPDCDFVLDAAPRPYPLSEVAKEMAEIRRRKTLRQPRVEPPVTSSFLANGGYGVEQYFLPVPGKGGDIIGSVHVFRADEVINAAANGADQLWDEIQQATGQGFSLLRNPVRTPGHKGEVLTRHFQQNWGAPYKFVVNVLSKGFSEAPDFILKALMRMDWAGRQSVIRTMQDTDEAGLATAETLDHSFTAFNELLSLGYMEGDSISYHDDGEDTLGPTVATLSLGSPAIMSFRPKKKHVKNHKEVLSFPLYHGDMAVMHGAEIHKYYEHKVDPKGKRRFAMTSRHIVLDRLDDETRAEAERKGRIPRHASKWQYSGQ